MSDQPEATKPKKKYSYPYVPKSQQRPTACLCSRPGVRYRAGWVCERCDRIENINAKRVARHNAATSQPTAKYADAYKCGMEGFK